MDEKLTLARSSTHPKGIQYGGIVKPSEIPCPYDSMNRVFPSAHHQQHRDRRSEDEYAERPCRGDRNGPEDVALTLNISP